MKPSAPSSRPSSQPGSTSGSGAASTTPTFKSKRVATAPAKTSENPENTPDSEGNTPLSDRSHPAGSGIHAAAAIAKKTLLSKTFTPKFILGLESKEKTEVFCVRYSPDGKMLAGSCGDSAIKIFNTNNGEITYEITSGEVLPLPCTCVRWRPQPESMHTAPVLVSADAGGNVIHWHVASKQELSRISQPNNQVFALDFRNDGSQFATAGLDRVVRIYDEETQKENRVLGGDFNMGGRFKTGHSNRVFSLKFSITEPNLLLSGGWDNTIQIWDLRDIHPVRSIFGPHICGDAVDLRGNTILTGSWRLEDPLQLWDLLSGSLMRTITYSVSDSNCCLYAAQFSKDSSYSRICAGGSGTHEAKIFETESGDLIGRVTGMSQGVYSIDFHPTLPQVAVSSGDGTVRLVDYPKP